MQSITDSVTYDKQTLTGINAAGKNTSFGINSTCGNSTSDKIPNKHISYNNAVESPERDNAAGIPKREKIPCSGSAKSVKYIKCIRYIKHMIRNLALLLAAFLAVFNFRPINAHAAYDSSRRETVRVGFFAMDGYHMMDSHGKRSGYGYDFLQLVSRYLDVDFDYIGYEKSWEDMQRMLENGDIDLLTSARKTPEREEKFDFSRPIGSSSAILSIRSDNSRIIMHDFTTYDGIIIALLNGNSRNNDLAEFAEENHFTYKPVYFDSTEEMRSALQAGRVDAIVTSSLRQTKNERIIEKFNTSEFYAIVKKGNTKLLNEINYAIDQMNAAEGDWRTELHNRFYENYNDRNLTFTDAEKKIISEYSSVDTPLTVVCDPTRYPYSYVENGEVTGIFPDYFRVLADYIGITYKFVPCESREEYLKHRSSGTADLCIDLRQNMKKSSELPNCALTAPYLTLRVAMVTRTDFDGEINVVSTVDQSAVFDDTYAGNAKKLVCRTREEAMQAVLDGKADASFVYYYTAQAFVNREKSGALTYTLLEETANNYRIAVSPQVNHALAGILTKAIYALPGSTIEDISGRYTTYRAKDITFLMLMQMHPIISICSGLFIAAVIIILLYGRILAQKKLVEVADQKAEEMKVLAEKADAANKAKSLFLANMSHDIRTPINGIMGLLKIDEANINDPDIIRANHEKIMTSADHLLSLINDVLQMSRLEDGEKVLTREVVDLRKLTNDVETIIKDRASDAGITWLDAKNTSENIPADVSGNTIGNAAANASENIAENTAPYATLNTAEAAADNIAENAPYAKNPYVYASPLHLRQIFLNIYGNCIKFTGTGGKITTTVKAYKENNTCTYTWKITDTGSGMSEEFLRHIFEPFAQERNDARSIYRGTGLGMPIVKNLVERMNGTIEVESRLGEGTSFIITIPFEIADTGLPAGKSFAADTENDNSGSADTADIAGMRLLVAEDNELNAEIAKTLLESRGASVTVVGDGKQAAELFSESPEGTFDAILMDIMMPVMDGLTAARTVRAFDRPNAKTIPIIAVTANAFAEDEQKCLDAGMNAHIAKPLDMEKLVSVLSGFRIKN